MSKRKAYSVKEKLKIIEKVKAGVSKSSISKELGIPKGTLSGWIANEDKLNKFIDKLDEDAGLDRKKTRLGKNENLEERLYAWYLRKKSKGSVITGLDLKVQAEKFHEDGQSEGRDFTANDSWLGRWRKRYGLSQISNSTEVTSSNAEPPLVNVDFSQQLKSLIKEEGYNERQIYNCDETALYYKMVPSKNLSSTHRTNILFCVNKTGDHKLKPVVIGKSKNPTCFKAINIKALPVDYRSRANSSMTTDTFYDWFHNSFVPTVQDHLKRQNQVPKALLILDNQFPENLVSSDGKVKAAYLPKELQPLNRGIIKAFKTNYRRDTLKALLGSVTTILNAMDLKDVSYNIGLAWQTISRQTIYNSWKDTPEEISLIQPNCFSDSDISRIGEILGEPDLTRKSLAEWVNVNDVENVCGEDEAQEEEADDSSRGSPPTTKEALAAMETVLRWVESQEDVDDWSRSLQLVSLKREMMLKLSRD